MSEHSDRTCPFCAEKIKTKAVICRYCGNKIAPIELKTSADKISAYLLLIENSLRKVHSKVLANENACWILGFLRRLKSITKIYTNQISATLVLIGCIDFIYYAFFADYSYLKEASIPTATGLVVFYRLQESLSIVAVGLIIYFQHLIPRNNYSTPSTELQVLKKSSGNFINFFSLGINAIALQFSIILMIFLLHNSELRAAYAMTCASLVIATTLIKTGRKIYGGITFFIGILYLAYRHIIYDNIFISTERMIASLNNTDHFGLYIDIKPYLWFLAISIAIPHTKLLKFSGLEYGGIKGDITIIIAGSEISIPFSSAFIFYILWCGFLNAITTIHIHFLKYF